MITFGIGHGAGGASPFAALGKPGIGIIHGIAQGVVSKLRGGSFRAGFAAGLIGHMAPTLNITGDSAAAIISRTLYAGLWGGLASMASGGKFEDGAFQAAMVHLFNEELGGLEEKREIERQNAKYEIYDPPIESVAPEMYVLGGGAALGIKGVGSVVKWFVGTKVGKYLLGKKGVLNSNRYLRVGLGRDGGNKVLRVSGELVPKHYNDGHIILKDLGPL